MQRNREAVLLDLRPQEKQFWQVKTDKIMAQFQCRCLLQDRWLRVLKIRLIFRRITNARNARTDEFYEWFRRISRITVGDCLTFPVNQQRFQVLVPCWGATNAGHLIHGMHLDNQENVFYSSFFYIWFAPHSFSRKSLLCDTKKDRVSCTTNGDRDLFRNRWRAR